MLRFNQKDAIRIDELQVITSRFRQDLMLAILWNKRTGADFHEPGVLDQLSDEARAAQSEIDEIVLRHRQRGHDGEKAPIAERIKVALKAGRASMRGSNVRIRLHGVAQGGIDAASPAFMQAIFPFSETPSRHAVLAAQCASCKTCQI